MRKFRLCFFLCIIFIPLFSLHSTSLQRKRKIRRTKVVRALKAPEPRFGFGFHGSMIKMVLGAVDHSTVEQWMGLQFNYIFDPIFSLSLNTAYGWVYPREPGGSQFSATSHFKTILVPANLCLNIAFAPGHVVRPCLSFGVGATHWDVRDIEKVKDSLLFPGATENGSTISPTFICGLGFHVFAVKNMAIDFSLRYHHLLKKAEDTIGTGDDNRGIIEARTGLTFYWSNYKDSDQDGIEDKNDLDPFAPEDFDGYKDHDGKPDFDNDNDGIPDKFDKAPNKPEDIDGFQDKDGIPDPDNDNDGILDKNDKCPNIAEDFDGFQDDDGCPEMDNDKDGIPDAQDKCPNYPETRNGYQDDDGCPDEKPAPKPAPKPKPVRQKQPIVLEGVQFRNGSAELMPVSRDKLFQIGRALIANPPMRIEIRGYTDSRGSARSNLVLSQRRAEAVKRFLVNFGIGAHRIVALGLGESKPIASNDTPEGRAKNRRIEFMQIK